MTKASGLSVVPLFDSNLAGNLQYRQGYPFPAAINVTNRGGGLGTATVLLDPMGERRLEDVFYADFRVATAFKFGQTQIEPAMSVFNIGNVNTPQSRRRVMYSYNATTAVGSWPSNANDISSIIAPPVIRFELKVNWWGSPRF